jgi:malate dehydrogenase (oxaloacetate-decarboxylating)(NADP+)
MIKAAVQAYNEGLCYPILLGNDEMIQKQAAELELSLEGIEVINLRHDNQRERRERYAKLLAEKRCREGYNFEEANDKMFERNYFGMMMVETGEADAFITGVYTKFSNTIKAAKEVIGIRPKYKHFGTMHIINSKRGIYYIADTLVNRSPDKETLKDIARLTADTIRFFNDEPKIAMISYSNFGVDKDGSPKLMADVVREMQEQYPYLKIDGEMSIDLALDHERRDEKYPFLRLHGEIVNSMIFTNLSAANSAYKLIQQFSPETEVIGPIQMGLNKPIHFTDFDSGVRDIVNITAVAVIDAYIDKLARSRR